ADAYGAALDEQLNQCLLDLESTSAMLAHTAGESAEDAALPMLARRLSDALPRQRAMNRRLTTMIELGITLSTERDTKRVLEVACRVAQELCEASYGSVGMLTTDGRAWRHYACSGFDAATMAAMQQPDPKNGVLAPVLNARRVLKVDDHAQVCTAIGLPTAHEPLHGLLAVPIASQDKVFGWLCVADKREGNSFGEVDERAATTVAAQLAVVYENLALYDEIRSQHKQLMAEVAERNHAQGVLRRALRARTVMAECNHVMVHAVDEAGLLHDTCRTLVDVGGYRSAQVDYFGEQGKKVVRLASAGQPPSVKASAQGNSTLTPPDSERSWLVIDIADPDGEEATEDLPSALAVSLPLRSQGHTFGVLTIHESGAEGFDSEHMAMLKGLADDIAFGVATLRMRNAREQAERNLRATEDKLSSILDSIDNVVWSATEHEFIYLNSMVEKIHGHPVEAFYRDRQLWFDAIHQDDRPTVRTAHARLRSGDSIVQEYRIVRPDGTVRWIEERARAIGDIGGLVQRVDGVAIDVSERKAYEARIEYLADHDALTGLANRNLLNDRLGQAIAHARRNRTQLALLFLDLDRFKGVNDSFGHSFGDALLLGVAARLREVVREGDTVARPGGDEFIILLTGIQRVDDVVTAIRKIFDALCTPFELEGREVFASTSIGIALFPEDGENMQTLLRNADTAMYRAKEERGNTFRFYSREMSERALERAELETALRRAIERKEFELFYQPKVDIRSHRIVGAEALIRWRHPRWGLVSPGRFIPLAEEIGLIGPIGDWVLQTACAQNKAWQDAGLPNICVSVNLSARQFADENLVSSVSSTLEQMALAPCHLELELTESVVMNSAELYINKLQQLQDLGVQLSIDDFGTGYSSLSYLKR
ncbi:MAG TPA: diguanylate cyclase, partial [Noviherbaspirillum sp.]